MWCRGEGEGIVIAVCIFVRVCVPIGKGSEGEVGAGREGFAWQMETAGPTERPSIVWPASASL